MDSHISLQASNMFMSYVVKKVLTSTAKSVALITVAVAAVAVAAVL